MLAASASHARLPASLPRRPQRRLERNPHQLASCPHARLLEQLLQSGLHRAFRYADLRRDFLVAESFENASQHFLLALRQELADALLFAEPHAVRSEEHTSE